MAWHVALLLLLEIRTLPLSELKVRLMLGGCVLSGQKVVDGIQIPLVNQLPASTISGKQLLPLSPQAMHGYPSGINYKGV